LISAVQSLPVRKPGPILCLDRFDRPVSGFD